MYFESSKLMNSQRFKCQNTVKVTALNSAKHQNGSLVGVTSHSGCGFWATSCRL